MNRGEEVILVVEDNPDDQHLLARAFRKAQVKVPLRFANDGDEALSALGHETPSGEPALWPVVILLDLKLPRRSGFQVLEWLKAHPALRRVPVVVLTSSREDQDLQRAYDLGVNSYLVKPTRGDALLQMVQQIDAYWLRLNEPASPLLRG
jgi:CheY-like chemotaxis protein